MFHTWMQALTEAAEVQHFEDDYTIDLAQQLGSGQYADVYVCYARRALGPYVVALWWCLLAVPASGPSPRWRLTSGGRAAVGSAMLPRGRMQQRDARGSGAVRM